MTSVDAAVIGTAIFGLITIFAVFGYRRRLRVRLKGPAGTNLRIDGENPEPSHAIDAKDLHSHEGKLDLSDQTGRGVRVAHASGKKDVTVKVVPEGRPIPKG